MGLDGVELIMAFEQSFGITISNEAAGTLLTPRPGRKWRREEVAAIVRQLIVEQMGTDQFTEDSRFVEDIGVG